jgi:excisionase family DNA binding protein
MDDRTSPGEGNAAAQDTPAAPSDAGAAAPDIGDVSGVLSAREAATALGISERTVRRAIQRGELVATKHAGMFQITPRALDDFRRNESSQGALSGAAAPASFAAASDTRQDAGTAVVVLQELLAEERKKSDRLLEAASVWQFRAVQAEDRLKQLTAGDVAPDAPSAAPEARHATEAADVGQASWWRRWHERLTGSG